MKTTRGVREDDYEKPSVYKQWHEKTGKPIAARFMTKDEIEEFRHNLVLSYDCDDKDITYQFLKIPEDAGDEDRDDCLLLIYRMKCVVAEKPANREIYTIKVPIPENLRQAAEKIYRERAQAKSGQSRPMRTLPAPASFAAANPQPEPARKIRKPIAPTKR